MLKKLFRRLAGPDPELVELRASLAGALTKAAATEELGRRLTESAASLERHQAELAERAAALEQVTDQLDTYRHLIVALLLRHGDSRIGGPILRAAATADFDAEYLGDQDCVELTLCD